LAWILPGDDYRNVKIGCVSLAFLWWAEARTQTTPTRSQRPLGCYGRKLGRTSRKTIPEAVDSSEAHQSLPE
jgi:hypothetical protein